MLLSLLYFDASPPDSFPSASLGAVITKSAEENNNQQSSNYTIRKGEICIEWRGGAFLNARMKGYLCIANY